MRKFSKFKLVFFTLMAVCILLLPLSSHAASSAESISFSKPKITSINAVKKKISIVFSSVKNAKSYEIFQYDSEKKKYVKIATTKSTTYTVTGLSGGKTYKFKIRARRKVNSTMYYSKFSSTASATTLKKGYSTIKTFLKTAIEPAGSTMYIWGGGWNTADTGAGDDARRIGVNPNWSSFFKKQTSSYDYTATKYQWGNGLDCSGFVGWSVYNILNTENGKKGYVTKASAMASYFSSLGWGSYIPYTQVSSYKPGDIMSASTGYSHVYIVIGACKDGSIVLVHSSPTGVQINGTTTPSGSTDSNAIKLARKYMKKYYPAWYSKYPSVSRSSSYLTDYSQMRWDITGSAIMTDPDNYSSMTAAQILKDLFEN